MRPVLVVAGLSEAATGIALLITPSLVGQLLFGVELNGIALTIAHIAGIALIALGVACWIGALVGMLTYSAAITPYLTYLGFASSLTGILLWPAIIVHMFLTGWLLFVWVHSRRVMALPCE
jgi:hypothetical protein